MRQSFFRHPLCLGALFSFVAMQASPAIAISDHGAPVLLAKAMKSKKSKKRRRGRKRLQKEEVKSAVSPEVMEWSRPVTPAESTSSILARANQLYQALEYDRVIPLAEAVLARPKLSLEERLEAYLLQGKSLAVVGDPIEAEKAFRLLLRARPDFRMDADSSPKILAVFRKVLVEETETQRLLEEALRKQIIANIRLSGEVPENPVGGYPLTFRYRVTDPSGSVEKVTLQYRRQGEAEYSALPLVGRVDGSWVGAIPGEWTSAEDGFTFEYCVVTADGTGPLLTQGTPTAPQVLAIAPGTLALATPPPLPLWSFGAAAGVTSILGLVSGGLALAVSATQAEYNELAETALIEPVSGKTMNAVAERGTALMWAQFIGLGSTALAGLGTAVMIPFTNWSGKTMTDISAYTQTPSDVE
jgi:hypothetical protein